MNRFEAGFSIQIIHIEHGGRTMKLSSRKLKKLQKPELNPLSSWQAFSKCELTFAHKFALAILELAVVGI